LSNKFGKRKIGGGIEEAYTFDGNGPMLGEARMPWGML